MVNWNRTMNLTLMHGIGNTFAIWDHRDAIAPTTAVIGTLAQALCQPAAGLLPAGWRLDGLLVLTPARTNEAVAGLRIFNADGSEAEMCGNGLRCVGRWLHEAGAVGGNIFQVATAAGLRPVQVLETNAAVDTSLVRVGLGVPVFDPARIPTTLISAALLSAALPNDSPLEVPLRLWQGEQWVTCLSLGNPHAVLFGAAWTTRQICRLGPQIERHPAFPNRTNVGFATVLAPNRLRLRVWERGVGETKACGTGAAAAVVAGIVSGRTACDVVVELPGGRLRVGWPAKTAAVTLTGEATTLRTLVWQPPVGQSRAA